MLRVVVVLVREGDRILMVQESKARVAGTWNLPGGRVELGESFTDAAVREVREEAGVEVQLTGLFFVDQVLSDAGDSRMRFVFQADLRTHELKSQPDEHSMRTSRSTNSTSRRSESTSNAEIVTVRASSSTGSRPSR